jgi:hypothetical protein
VVVVVAQVVLGHFPVFLAHQTVVVVQDLQHL